MRGASEDHEFRQIVFLLGSLRLGGIETLCIRLANHYAQRGWPTTVVATHGPLLASLSPAVRHAKARSPAHLLEAVEEAVDDGISAVLVSFDPTTAAEGLVLEGRWRAKVRHITGVYHPRAYRLDGEDWLRFLLNAMLGKSLPERSVTFINNEARESHEHLLGRSFRASSIIPLPIEETPVRWRHRPGAQLRVISIGRLVPFKSYNLEAANIVRGLVDCGVDIKWDIVGEGELQGQMETRFAAPDLQGRVRLLPQVPYDRLRPLLLEYDLFVGMGTTAIEAAAIGMPVIVATENEGRNCNGFFDEVPFGNVGERGTPTSPIVEVIERYWRIPQVERTLLAERGRTQAGRHSISCLAEEYLNLASRLRSRSPLLARLAGHVYLAMTTGRTRAVLSAIKHSFAPRRVR